MDDRTPPVTPEKYCWTWKWSAQPVAFEFFRQSKTAPDQLRLRMAHVWHQIFVINQNGGVGGAYAHAEFHQRLRDHAFGTFENLLLKYALSPQLGQFQNWVKNVPERNGIRPNENFARELLQIFTIGVDMLNDDGTPKLDAAGKPIPSYGQADIETLARVLTGYTFPTMPGKTPGFWENDHYFIGDMIPFNAPCHDDGYKNLLNGRLILYSGGGAENEVRAAIRMLVDHPNTPAFISKQLIQKTVTSSPTPGYVKRVADVFSNNGYGVRGDLAAVTRAILLDPEARGARKIDVEYGRLREPVLFWTAMIRALDVTTDGWNPYGSTAWQSQQQLFEAPTVFNYYPADYVLPGTGVPAPEFGIFTSAEILNRANQINDLLYNVDMPWTAQWWGPQPWMVPSLGTPSPSMAAFLADAGNPEALVARMDRLLLHGTMTAPMRKVIVNAVNKVPRRQAAAPREARGQPDPRVDRLPGAEMSRRIATRPPIPSPIRRRLLQAMVASGLVGLAERNRALAQAPPGYKALVCLFQQGGNDGENMLVRLDTAGYQKYNAVRPPASSLNIPQGAAGADPADQPRHALRLPPGLRAAQAALRREAARGDRERRRARAPSARAGLENGSTPRPSNLFSHPNMELAVQSADASGFTRTGWGGRAADRLEAMTPQILFPALTSINSLRSYSLANTSIPLTVPDNPWFTLGGSADWEFDVTARRGDARDPGAAAREHLRRRRADPRRGRARRLVDRAPDPAVDDLGRHAVLRRLQHAVGRQLKTIAQLIEARAQTKVPGSSSTRTSGATTRTAASSACTTPCSPTCRRRSPRSRPR